MKKLTFTAFSDMHYRVGMYSTTVKDLMTVIGRAKESGSQFMIHCGDMCNNYVESPELIKPYLGSGIPVYGVYGNHELEGQNSMEMVTPQLTNDKDVVWGTEDGKIGDGTVAYYYKDLEDDFRIVATDTNYAFDPATGEWVHNKTCSWGPAPGTLFGNSLGPVQFAWLEKTLIASAKEGKKCLILSHAAFHKDISGGTPDTAGVQQLFARVNAMKKGTVTMVLNGHYHTNRMFQENGIVYFDINTTRNIWWQLKKEPHYVEGQGQMVEELDEQGNVIGEKWQDYNTLWMSENTWFCEDALSAVVTITDEEISIDGVESKWVYDMKPEQAYDVCEPRISSKTFKL